MHLGALQALEFDRILEVLRSQAATPLGAVRLAALRPSSDARRVAHGLAATTEGVKYADEQGAFPLQAPPDLEAILASLAIEGRPLEPGRLLALATFLESIELTRSAIRRVDDGFPILRTLAEAGSSFKGEIANVRHAIDEAGEVQDQASPELRSIRDRLRRQRTRLRGTLESFLRSKDTARYLQDQIVTDRNGRYVLVVRAEHRASIPGIIHGSSASGASLYLEPLSTVDINNEVIALQEQETAEVRRILLALADSFRHRALDLQRTVEVATDLDVLQAKARLSAMMGGIEPALMTERGLDLHAARHPLLMASIASRLDAGSGASKTAEGLDSDGDDRTRTAGAGERVRAAEPVPVDIALGPNATVLIITGPNTGGKTVALKTAGLLAMMAQAGLHIPAARGSRLSVFRSIFSDIGDEQSIAANLSTFSWHITHIAAMDESLALPALVLLDEVGAGTDPTEGGALGMAIVDHFLRRGALVVATTHYDALKSYASTTAGVQVAAFGFNPETFAPTYQLTYGSPGRSLALEIAGRLGLRPSILEAARTNVSAREAQLADHLAKMDQELRGLEHERRLVARERESLDEGETRLRQRDQALRQREEVVKHRIDEQVGERIREARHEIDRVIDELKQRASTLSAEATRRARESVPVLSTGEAGTVRTEARAALDAVAARLASQAGSDLGTSAAHASLGGEREGAGPPPVIGDHVSLRGLGLEGRLLGIQDGDAEIDVHGKRLRAKVQELMVIGRPQTTPATRVNVSVQLQPRPSTRSGRPELAEGRENTATELNVIGCTVDEALTRAEKFLDEALLTDARTIRVIHGYGTGQLRRAFAEFLEKHPLVAHFQSAPPEQGGGGVTVVELKE